MPEVIGNIESERQRATDFRLQAASPWKGIEEILECFLERLRSLSVHSYFIQQIQDMMGFYSHAQSFEDAYVPIQALRWSFSSPSARIRRHS